MLYDEYGIFTGLEESYNDLAHYGTPRHSGRYPWGSGDNPYQRNQNFLSRIDELKKQGFTDKQIYESMGMNSSEFRQRKALARAENRAYLQSHAQELKDKGMSVSAIGRTMGMNESSVRSLLDESRSQRMSRVKKNAELLKERLNAEPGTYIQVGSGTEYYLNGVSKVSLGNTLKALKDEGYTVENIQVSQLGTGHKTTVKVLAAPGTTWAEIMNNKDKIRLPFDIHAENDGQDLKKTNEYVSIDPKRVMINYAETGGTNKDGVIELRRGVDDISLGKNHYAQVRILVGGTHYLKGMAMYADDLPDGVDIRFNTNKHEGTPMMSDDPKAKQVLKPIKEGQENPFGANVKPEEKLTRCQRHYIGADGQEHQSALNIVKEEGDVDSWSRTLASQFLSKQPVELAKRQLKLSYDIAKAEMDELNGYTNPTVKAKMLEDFAGRCESDAVHLQAAALPRQANKFILPLTNVQENEIYAPSYRDGEQVALIRYPHAGGFEIPILTVNNNNALAKRVIGEQPIDAVGIHPSAAERLSGADFDGDTALVIPVDNLRLRASANNRSAAFKQLDSFDPKEAYPGYEGMKELTSANKGREMGVVTNLITDMTVQGAPESEIVRAVRHSMVIIDAEKHKLDYIRSEQENGIAELKKKYQSGGASTLLSRSTRDERVPDRKEKAFSKMTPEEKERWKNGEIIYEYSGKMIKSPKFKKSKMTPEERADYDSGDPVKRHNVELAMYRDKRVEFTETQATNKVAEGFEHNPYELVSGGSRERTSPIERAYADYAIQMKDLARQARKEARAQVDIPVNPEAKAKYAPEVASLKAKLAVAKKNAPLEKQAQIAAGKEMKIILQSHPELYYDKEHYKREKSRQLDYARARLGAKKQQIGTKDNPLTDREWEAIQAGAIPKTVLKEIIGQTDSRRIRELASPKQKVAMNNAKIARAKAMIASGYPQEEIAAMLDVSVSTLMKAVE